ncbi:uncharacterized protein LOC143020967 isoform X2 [Oratosquilla oratoria]
MEVDIVGSNSLDSEGCDDGDHNDLNHSNDDRLDRGGGGNSMNTSSGSTSKLKRSSSAPMINQLVQQSTASAQNTQTPSRDGIMSEVCGAPPRVRRFSATFGPVSPLSPGSSRAAAHVARMRVNQLRQEEGMDVVNREAAHERTVQSSLQVAQCLSQSCEDLTLTEDVPRTKAHSVSGGSTGNSLLGTMSSSILGGTTATTTTNATNSYRRDFSDPLHLTIVPTVVPIVGCAASPTRVGRQCFSPSLQQHVRNTSFSPSPSPTKKTFTSRRSLSPIALRPSPLGLKRKFEFEERCDFLTPSKRPTTGSFTTERCMGGLLLAQSHNVGSLENTPSPAPGSVSSVGTPDSVCSSGSPCPPAPPYSPASLSDNPNQTGDPPPHMFKPVSPALASEHTTGFGGPEQRGYRPSDQGGGGFTSHLGSLRNDEKCQHSSDSSSDAMLTEDVPATTPEHLKPYQAMDLSDSLPQTHL